MADPIRFDDTLKRVFDANLQAYEGLSRVMADYVQTLARVWMEAGTSVLGRAAAAPASAARSASASAPPPPRAASAVPQPPSPVALVLEAKAGEVAQGVVMVENRLPRRVTATVVTSAFSNEAGEEIWPTLRVQPGTVDLEPGARTLVQIGALVDDRLEAGVRYRGQVTVPDLSDTPIPVVLQRTPTGAVPTSAPPEPVQSAEQPNSSRGAGTRARRSGSSGKRHRKPS
jgi:hypothetical protein